MTPEDQELHYEELLIEEAGIAAAEETRLPELDRKVAIDWATLSRVASRPTFGQRLSDWIEARPPTVLVGALIVSFLAPLVIVSVTSLSWEVLDLSSRFAWLAFGLSSMAFALVASALLVPAMSAAQPSVPRDAVRSRALHLAYSCLLIVSLITVSASVWMGRDGGDVVVVQRAPGGVLPVEDIGVPTSNDLAGSVLTVEGAVEFDAPPNGVVAVLGSAELNWERVELDAGPNVALAKLLHGNYLQEQGRVDDALVKYREVLAIEVTHSNATGDGRMARRGMRTAPETPPIEVRAAAANSLLLLLGQVGRQDEATPEIYALAAANRTQSLAVLVQGNAWGRLRAGALLFQPSDAQRSEVYAIGDEPR